MLLEALLTIIAGVSFLGELIFKATFVFLFLLLVLIIMVIVAIPIVLVTLLFKIITPIPTLKQS